MNTKQGIKVFAVQANLGAGEVIKIFGQEQGIQFLAFEKSAEIGVTGLGSNLTRGHPQVSTDNGVKPKSKV